MCKEGPDYEPAPDIEYVDEGLKGGKDVPYEKPPSEEKIEKSKDDGDTQKR